MHVYTPTSGFGPVCSCLQLSARLSAETKLFICRGRWLLLAVSVGHTGQEKTKSQLLPPEGKLALRQTRLLFETAEHAASRSRRLRHLSSEISAGEARGFTLHGGSDILRRALARLCNKTRLQRANIIGHCAANTCHTDYPEAQPPDASEMRSPALLPCAFDGARSRSTRGLCPANAPATISHGTATACGACHQPAGIHIARPVWRVTGSHQRTPALPLT